jgi:hypothetical protein
MALLPRALVDVAAGRSVSPVVDPDALLASATAHGLTGLLWSRVRDGEVELPREQALTLAAVDVAQREHHAALESALIRATRLLDEQGISSATFKGVRAEHRWYERVGDRPCRDVDLVLCPDDVRRLGAAVDLLDPHYRLRAGLDRRVELGVQQAATVSFDGVTIDLHVEVPKFGVPSRSRDLVWRHAITHRSDEGAEVRVLDAEGQLFAFLTHVVKDRFARMLNYVDVFRIATQKDLDWDAVRAIARADSLEAPLARALGVVAATLEVELETPMRPPLMPSPSWSILCRENARLTGSQPRPRSLLLMPLVIPGRRREVLRSLVRRAVPTTAVGRDLYPDESANPVKRLWRSRGAR